MTIEPIPDDCLPPQEVIDELLRGPKIGPDGKIVDGIWAGMTQEEVLSQRDAYDRMDVSQETARELLDGMAANIAKMRAQKP